MGIGVLDAADVSVVVLYFAAVMGVGLWSSFRNRGSVGGYFLAGRSMHFIPVGASLFASNIGSGHFIGLAGSGAASGIGIAAFELNAIFVLMVLGWIFVPVYIAAGVYTMPEYLRKRFGGQRIRIYLSVLALLLYIFTKISADLYAGAIFIEESIHINLYPAVIILLSISALFSVLGGLTAVIWTDLIQTVIMIIGALFLMVKSFITVGGYQGLLDSYFQAAPNTSRLFTEIPTFNSRDEVQSAANISYRYSSCGFPPQNAMHLIRPSYDDILPWTGVVFGLTVSSVWYWCSDQVIVQRALAAKSLTHAKAGVILAGWLKMFPMWLLVFPGMVARVLFPDTVGCGDAEQCMRECNKPRGCTDNAYPKLVLHLMPSGAKGLMLAVMVASLVSSLTSIFNSSSTIFTMDIWKRIRRDANDVELMIVGRVFVLGMVIVGVAWIPIVQSGGELFHYIQSVTSYLSPPVCAVYVLALFWKRCNEKGAFASLMVGLVIGMIRFIWENCYPQVRCGHEDEDIRPNIITKMHYLHFGVLLFALCVCVAVVVSLLTEPIKREHLVRLLFWNRHSKETRLEFGKQRNKPAVPHDPTDADVAKSSQGLTVDTDTEKDRVWYWRAAYWICGIENAAQKPQEAPLTEEELHELEAKQSTCIDEKPLWKLVTNINALFLLTCALLVWGFFA